MLLKQNILLNYYFNTLYFKFKRKSQILKVTDFNYKEFLGNLDIKPNSKIFIHAGLKSIKIASGDSYQEIVKNIINTLKDLYNPFAIITPTFTPSFRKSGVYSKLYSKGEYGVFSEIPRFYADYRTDDAIHSVAIFSENIDYFKHFNYQDTFSEDGFYASLNDDNSYILNISTQYFVSTYMHYIEESMKVPYKKKNSIWKGVLFDENNTLREIEQKNHGYSGKIAINRNKIEQLFIKEQIIKYKYYNNLKVSLINVRDLDLILKEQILKNPYYLVTI